MRITIHTKKVKKTRQVLIEEPPNKGRWSSNDNVGGKIMFGRRFPLSRCYAPWFFPTLLQECSPWGVEDLSPGIWIPDGACYKNFNTFKRTLQRCREGKTSISRLRSRIVHSLSPCYKADTSPLIFLVNSYRSPRVASTRMKKLKCHHPLRWKSSSGMSC